MEKDTQGATPGICTVPPVDLCPNIAGVQTTLPAGMTVDGSGNCITPPVIVDLCTNLAGVQETVPAGMEKDTQGATPGICTTPVVDQCPNIAGTQATVPAGMTVNASGNCVTPVTYSWATGTWGACSLAAGNDWRDFYGSGPMSTVGQSCTSWINAQPQAINNGSQTRNVFCKDSNGTTVADSFCDWMTKPINAQVCTVPLQVRVKVTTDNLGTQTVNYTNPGQCLYAKLQNPSNPDPLANMFPLDCQVRTTGQSAPSGFNPAASCFLLNFSGGPSDGFNAGNPGGWTATGSGTWQLQVKPQ